MYFLLKKEWIVSFLLNYGIDFEMLSLAEQSQVILLSHIFFLLFWFIVAYVLYRVFIRLFR